jgi:hypothetical protein
MADPTTTVDPTAIDPLTLEPIVLTDPIAPMDPATTPNPTPATTDTYAPSLTNTSALAEATTNATAVSGMVNGRCFAEHAPLEGPPLIQNGQFTFQGASRFLCPAGEVG